MNILVTGGAGFIGSALCRHLVADPDLRVVNLDKLSYAGNLASLRQVERLPNYRFVERLNFADFKSYLWPAELGPGTEPS